VAGIAHLKKTTSERTKKPLSDRSVHSYGKALLVFCHWIEQEEMIEKPISTRFKNYPKWKRSLFQLLALKTLRGCWKHVKKGDVSKPQLRKALTARNRAIVSLFLDTGIRLKRASWFEATRY